MLTAAIFLAWSFPCFAAETEKAPEKTEQKKETRYEYERKDKKKEQQKLVEKLKQDKTKVELAIGNTKMLIDKSRNMPYLPELYLRLSELYIEKARIVFIIRKNEGVSQGSEALDSLEANTLKNQAIETYLRILNDFPDYPSRDKIHFFLAHEYRELNQIPEMVSHYRDIIKKYPQSPYTPESYLLLGDHFISKQDLTMAIRHYTKVLDYPTSSAIVIARYKLAWSHVNNRDFEKAISLFEQSVATSEPGQEIDVDTYKRVDIKLESLVDMAYCYPEVYKDHSPEAALAYFKKYSWSRQVYAYVLEKLGSRYMAKKKYRHGVEIFRTLASLRHDEDQLLEYARNIVECVQALSDYKNADKDVEIIVRALTKEKYTIHVKDEEKAADLKDYEAYARNIVTHLHTRARNDKSTDSYRIAADAYKVYLDFFENSPVYTDMLSNYAEALFASNRFLEAGKQYERLIARIAQPVKPEPVEAAKEIGKEKGNETDTKTAAIPVKDVKKEDSDVPDRKELLDSVVISYYNALKKKDDLNYYDVAYARSGLKENGNLFVKENPTSPRVPDILFNVAWIAYDDGKYDDAIKEFGDFIAKYTQGKAAESAVHLTLDAYHLKEDFSGLVEFGRKVVQDTRFPEKVRKDVADVIKASESRIVSNLTIDAMNDWELGKQSIEDVVEKNKETGLGEQALHALIVSSKDKGKLDTVFSAGYKLIKYYPESEHSADVLAIMIDCSVSASQYRVTARYLEEFARRLPKHAKTPEFIRQAAEIRKSMGQNRLAAEDFMMVLDRTPKKTPGRTEVMFGIYECAKKSGDVSRAVDVLIKGLGEMQPSERVRALSLAAEYAREKGDYKEALSYRKDAIKEFKPGYVKQDPDMAEAYAAMTFNAVQGSYDTYMKTRLSGVIDDAVVAEKAKLLENLESGYASVIACQSPEYVLKACYFAYEINKEFSVFLKNSPLPEGLSDEQKDQYRKLVDDQAASYMTKGEQYLTTGKTQAEKWGLLHSEIAGLYSGTRKTAGNFGGKTEGSEIAEQFLKDEELNQAHYTMFHDRKNPELMMNLADLYAERGDYPQARLLAFKAVELGKGKSLKIRADKLIGVADLYIGDDIAARQAFKDVLAENPEDTDALINLAALLKHYHHDTEADAIYKTLPGNLNLSESNRRIHPVARDMYHGFSRK